MKCYFPTSTLNFDCILSSQKVFPSLMYKSGTLWWNHFELTSGDDGRTIVLYTKCPKWTIEDLERDNYPMVVEIDRPFKKSEIVELSGLKAVVLQRPLEFSQLDMAQGKVRFLFRSEKEKRLLCCSALFSFIVSTFTVIGVSIARMRRISWIWESRNYLINFLNLYYAQFILYFCISYLAFRWLKKNSINQNNSANPVFSFRRVLLWWGILTLFFLPWYLHLYPGVLTQDSGDQIYDAITTNTLSDHHSAFLTLVMRGILLPIRQASGSLQLSVGICVLLQMLIVTFVFACSYEWIRLYLQNRVLRAAAFLYYALHPIYPIYSITLWKDILFSACFLALILCLDSLNRDEAAFFSSKKKKTALFLTMLLLPLMRHNGIAITLVTGVYLFLATLMGSVLGIILLQILPLSNRWYFYRCFVIVRHLGISCDACSECRQNFACPYIFNT